MAIGLILGLLLGSPEYPPIYVSIVSHNEEPLTGQFPDFTADPDTFWVHRNAVVRFAEMLHEVGAKYNFQSDWNFLLAAVMYDTGTVHTNGKNFLRFLVEDLGFEVDPHAHETIYNYADVAYLMEQLLGYAPSHTVGGYIASPPSESKIEYFRDTLYGWHYPYAWKAEILWGGSTPGHLNEDSLYVSGIWRPQDNENYLSHDPEAPLPEVGGYNRQWDGLWDLLAKQENGELVPGRIYTHTLFVGQNQLLDTAFVQSFRQQLLSLADYVSAGRIVFVGLREAVEIWKTEYDERPNLYSYLYGDITRPLKDTFWLTMDDGVRLEVTLFRPVDAPPPGGFPALVFIHGLGGSKRRMEPKAERYARWGYVTLAYSVRGQGNSEGLTTLFSFRERQDLDSVVRFLRGLPEVNDTLIGVSGASQGGFHAWFSAVDRLPGVRAVAPENSTPMVSETVARNGVYLYPVTVGLEPTPTVRIDTLAYPMRRFLLADDYDSVRALASRGRDFDSSQVAQATAHFLIMGAWHDHAFWTNRLPGAFQAAPHRSLLYLGTGGHGSEASLAESLFREQLKRLFFNALLKGETAALDTLPSVIVALGPDWRHLGFATWPPPGLSWVRYHLHSDGSLSPTPPGPEDTTAHLVHHLLDPSYTWEDAVEDNFLHVPAAFLLSRQTWRTPPLPDTLILLGAPRARIFARSTASRMQINLQLFAEAPGGDPLIFLSQVSLGVRENPDPSQWHLLEGSFNSVGWIIPPGYRLRLDWVAVNFTAQDTFLWSIPYWESGLHTLSLGWPLVSWIEVPFLLPSSVTDGSPGAAEKVWFRVIPNPCSHQAVLEIRSPYFGVGTVEIYSSAGRRVSAVEVGPLSPGYHCLPWENPNLPTGVYLLRLLLNGQRVSQTPVMVVR